MTRTCDDNLRDLDILEQLEAKPDSTQAVLATQLGVAVGTINWHVKRLVEKGFLKIQRLERRKIKYIVTPEGISLRSRLTIEYIQSSFQFYRLIRQKMKNILERCAEANYQTIILSGEGDVAEICRLTGLEQGFVVLERKQDMKNRSELPVVEIHGLKLVLKLPEAD